MQADIGRNQPDGRTGKHCRSAGSSDTMQIAHP